MPERVGRQRQLQIEVAHALSALTDARRQVRGFLQEGGVPEHEASDVVLCLQEALKNAVRFAKPPAPISIRVSLAERAVTCRVRDRGAGLDVSTLRVVFPIPPDPLAESGRGFLIMTSLMDEVELRNHGGLEVCMRKRLPRRRPRD